VSASAGAAKGAKDAKTTSAATTTAAEARTAAALGLPQGEPPRFASLDGVRSGLAEVGYLADESISGVVYLADRLSKPVLVEGPAGTGKTQLAKSVAELAGARLIRLQCYEGLDESFRPGAPVRPSVAVPPGKGVTVRRGRSWKRTSSPRSSSWPVLCSKPSAPPSRWCC